MLRLFLWIYFSFYIRNQFLKQFFLSFYELIGKSHNFFDNYFVKNKNSFYYKLFEMFCNSIENKVLQ